MPPLPRSIRARSDVVLALGLALAAQVEGAFEPAGKDTTLGAPIAVVLPLSLAMTLPLAFRRQAPLAVSVAVNAANAAGAVATGAALSSLTLWVAWLCAMYTMVVRTDTRGFAAGVAVTAASFAVIGAGVPEVRAGTLLWLACTVLAMAVLRRVVRTRDDRVRTLAHHAELLERERELRAREAVLEERARIARELHDVVAHEVSMIVVQAGVERRVTRDAPGTAHETLGAIESGGRHALAEMRRLLGLRLGPDDGVPLAPAPSLGDVDALVDRVRGAGAPVALTIEGRPRALPAGLDASAYRIVQEALTNSVRHAAGARVEVTVRYGDRELELDVRDDGAGTGDANGDGSGHGLIGMRERAELYGGVLEAGPLAGGGFGVHARLPIDA